LCFYSSCAQRLMEECATARKAAQRAREEAGELRGALASATTTTAAAAGGAPDPGGAAAAAAAAAAEQHALRAQLADLAAAHETEVRELQRQLRAAHDAGAAGTEAATAAAAAARLLTEKEKEEQGAVVGQLRERLAVAEAARAADAAAHEAHAQVGA
jgi:hypothetical protein